MPQTLQKRPCRFCRRWFRPDPRLGARQRVCGDEACQWRRQAANQRAWLLEHPGYFRGPARAAKHRAYRAAHPEVQRRRRAKPEVRERERLARAERRRRGATWRAVEQEAIHLQLLGPQRFASRVAANPAAVEQEAMRSQLLVLVGLASALPPGGAQEPIAGSLRGWHDRGRRLLGGAAR